MNKTQLVDALAARLGDRRTAAAAVDGLLETIVDAVGSGDSVALTGFGVFEARPRAARMGRNPRTGEPVEVPATTVPAFRPGASFRTAVGGAGAAEPRAARTSTASATVAGPAPATESPARTAEPARDADQGKDKGKGKKAKAKSKAKDDKPKKGKKK
jgi:DNA-binding protein HU-beta